VEECAKTKNAYSAAQESNVNNEMGRGRQARHLPGGQHVPNAIPDKLLHEQATG